MRALSRGSAKLVGNVDHVGSGEIRGWACLLGAEGTEDRRDVALVVGGKAVLETTADGYRGDVAKATNGSSRVGFTFRLDDDLLEEFGGKEFKVADATSGAVLPTTVLLLPTVEPRTLLDVGDTLIFFQSHGISTGIQRVVTEVARALEASDGVHLVAGAADGSGVRDVDLRLWQRLLRALTQDAQEAIKVAGEILGDVASGPALRPRQGDVLIVLGATWISEQYLQSAIAFRQAGGGLVFMIYDLIPVRLSHMFNDLLRTLFTRFIVSCSLVADGVLCISEFTRRDFESYCAELGVVPPRTEVSRLASSLTGASVKRSVTSQQENAWASSSPAGYALLVSTIEGRKGHALLLRAWSRLLREHGRDAVPDLIFVGRPGWHAQDTFAELSRTGYLDGKVHVLSSVPDQELTRLYADAAFTVYPSMYEGWGLPVAESLTCGTPVIASDSTSIPEVGGDFVSYFQSGDERGLYDALERWILHPDELAAARKRVRDFRPDTWQDVSESVLNLAREISADAVSKTTWSPSLPYGQEISFGSGELLTDNSTFIEASWQQQVINATPILQQPRQSLSNALGNLVLRGELFDPEPNGRWNKLTRPVTLRFRLSSSATAVAYLALSSGSDDNPTLVSVRGNCRPDSVWCGNQTLIKLQLVPTDSGEVSLELETQRRAPLEDQRPLGVFFKSLLALRADDMNGQLVVVEAQAGIRSRGASGS